MNNKNYNKIQISQLKRDILIIQDILDEKIENYTNHPIPVLKDALSNYQDKLYQLLEFEDW